MPIPRQISIRPARPIKAPLATTAITLILALAASILSLGVTSTAGAQATIEEAEQMFIDGINEERAAVGAAPLVLSIDMRTAAREWTDDMVSREKLEHASNIIGGVPDGWTGAGENVGRGGTVPGLMRAFMRSDGHRENLLNPDYTHIGVGVGITPRNVMYTTHRFAAVPGGVAPPVNEPTAPQPTPIPPTPVPPTPTPVPPTPVPPTPVPPTPVPPTPTPVPPTPIPPTPVPPTPVPPTPVPEPTPEPPSTLAFVDAPDESGVTQAEALLSPPPATYGATTDQIVQRFSWLIDLLMRIFGSRS